MSEDPPEKVTKRQALQRDERTWEERDTAFKVERQRLRDAGAEKSRRLRSLRLLGQPK